MQALILSGGLGTRLKSISGDLPKPLVPIAGRPVIEHQLDCLARGGITDVVFIAGYRADLIEEHIRKHPQAFPVRVFAETEPLGSAGGVLARLGDLQESFFVIYGDTIFDIDLQRMREFHRARSAQATLLVHPNDHPDDSDLIAADRDGKIRAFFNYPHAGDLLYRNLVNAGVYLLEAAPLRTVAKRLPVKLDFAKHVFPALLADGVRLFGYASREYIKDMGTPERFAKVERAILSGQVERMSMRHPAPVIFFDRDGTLTSSLEYVVSKDQLELLPDAAAAVRIANAAGYLSVLTTNQPVVARGELSFEGLDEIHRKLETELGRAHAYLDGIYICPHHPDRGFAGEVPELKGPCRCRKPEIGMLEDADRDLKIDHARSWVVGDTTVDIQCARSARAKSVLVRTGYAGRDGKYPVLPDFEFDHVGDAVRFIAEDHLPLRQALEQWLESHPVTDGDWISISGPARSGKSILAGTLGEVLSARGQECVRIALDGWLLPEGERKPGFRGRFDLAATEVAIERFAGPGEFEVPVYDRETRAPFPWKTRVAITPRSILIFEGVSAALSPSLVKKARYRIWVDPGVNVRRARFLEHYRQRKYDKTRAETLFSERESEEVRDLESLRDMANWFWSTNPGGDR